MYLVQPVINGLLEVSDLSGVSYVSAIKEVKGNYIGIRFEGIYHHDPQGFQARASFFLDSLFLSGSLAITDEYIHTLYEAKRLRSIPDLTAPSLRIHSATTVVRSNWLNTPRLTWTCVVLIFPLVVKFLISLLFSNDPDNYQVVSPTTTPAADPTAKLEAPTEEKDYAAAPSSGSAAVAALISPPKPSDRIEALKQRLLEEVTKLRNSQNNATPSSANLVVNASPSSPPRRVVEVLTEQIPFDPVVDPNPVPSTASTAKDLEDLLKEIDSGKGDPSHVVNMDDVLAAVRKEEAKQEKKEKKAKENEEKKRARVGAMASGNYDLEDDWTTSANDSDTGSGSDSGSMTASASMETVRPQIRAYKPPLSTSSSSGTGISVRPFSLLVVIVNLTSCSVG